jgi:hypothetical protein
MTHHFENKILKNLTFLEEETWRSFIENAIREGSSEKSNSNQNLEIRYKMRRVGRCGILGKRNKTLYLSSSDRFVRFPSIC